RRRLGARAVAGALAASGGEVAAPGGVAAGGAPPVLEGLRAGATPVTWAIIAANVIVFAVVTAIYGSTTEPWVLARVGANFHPAVAAREWWRLIPFTFLHLRAPPIGGNMLGVWNIGRVVEQLVGPLRFGAIYAVSGIGGSVASYLFSRGLSAGASGALFGIVGAAIVEIWLRRGKRKQAWRTALLNNLIFIALAT